MTRTLQTVFKEEFADTNVYASLDFRVGLPWNNHDTIERYKEFDEAYAKLLGILRDHNVQCEISTCTNALNSVSIKLCKQTLISSPYSYNNWGHPLTALEEITKHWPVWFYHPDEAKGYYLEKDMTVRESFKIDDGGC